MIFVITFVMTYFFNPIYCHNNMASIAVILRKNYKKEDGTYPIYLRLTIDRKSKIYSLNQSTNPAFWDEKKYRVSAKHLQNYKVNAAIQDAWNRADKILFDHDTLNQDLTFELFEKLYFKAVEENKADISYYDFATKQMALRKNSVSAGHNRQCYYELEKMKKFRTQVKLAEIDYKFLQEYEQYMRKLGNKTNTVNKTFSKLRTFLNIAIKNDMISKNPFERYKIKHEPTNRQYLTVEELEQLEKKYSSGELNSKLADVLQYFLFACYTGLRYTDLHELTYNNIKDDHIVLTMHKTKEEIIIPLIDKAKALIPVCKFPGQKVFRVLTNQKCNDYIKLIMLAVEINKNISFHCSRHTFATVSITLGIPIEVVSKLLGHNDLKTTQIYAKIVNKKKFDEMEKWNKI